MNTNNLDKRAAKIAARFGLDYREAPAWWVNGLRQCARIEELGFRVDEKTILQNVGLSWNAFERKADALHQAITMAERGGE